MKRLKIIDEFKEFAMKGNVIDMAVGVIIGGAFGKIISSLVNDIIMPLISILTGRVDISSLSFKMTFFDNSSPIELNYGLFLQNILDFLIVAFCIFAVIKMTNIFKKKQVVQEKKPETPSNEEKLLTEIRDLLKERK